MSTLDLDRRVYEDKMVSLSMKINKQQRPQIKETMVEQGVCKRVGKTKNREGETRRRHGW